MRFKTAAVNKKTHQREFSIIRNTLGNEEEDDEEDAGDEDDEQFEDIRIEEGESFANRASSMINR
jgi:hypothetical protein